MKPQDTSHSPTDVCECGKTYAEHHKGNTGIMWCDALGDPNGTCRCFKSITQETVKPSLTDDGPCLRCREIPEICDCKPQETVKPDLYDKCECGAVYANHLHPEGYCPAKGTSIGWTQEKFRPAQEETVKHTAGPWKAHEITSMDWWVILADKPLAKDVVHETIAQVDKGLNNGDPNPNAKANAELIARAPQMLVELEQLRAELEKEQKRHKDLNGALRFADDERVELRAKIKELEANLNNTSVPAGGAEATNQSGSPSLSLEQLRAEKERLRDALKKIESTCEAEQKMAAENDVPLYGIQDCKSIARAALGVDSKQQ